MASILENINSPADIKQLCPADLVWLSDEVRTRIIETVSDTGGHLAANLGVVELTVALLRIFDPPEDAILLDTSHQCYAYKLLTGRRDRFGTLRQHGGLSGFLSRAESPYDVFGAGHAGTALSAALGLAVARDQRESARHVVAVVGDAGMGCGITLEALNNAAVATQRLIVVLNDNEMSIAENVGSLSQYLGRMLSNPRYNRWKESVEDIARKMRMGGLRSSYYRLEEAVKGLFVDSVLFEEFGLRYVGPVDGHAMPALLDALTLARHSEKPILVHVKTKKGRGYPFAETQPERWHGAGQFDIASGNSKKAPGAMSYSEVFGRALERLAEADPRLIAITAAMAAGTGLTGFAERFPERFHDVGMCEEHAAVFAAGLAAGGLRPVFAVYSTFLQRAIDCVIHDVCLQALPVVFCLDRAGVVGDDGPTHHGVFDIALLRPVPGLLIMQPRNEVELCRMLKTALDAEQPAAIRYPRGAGPGMELPDVFEPLPIGRAEVLEEPGAASGGTGPVWLWAIGDMLPLAEETRARLEAEGIAAGVVDARFICPLDTALLRAQAGGAGAMVTLENGVVRGGFGEGVAGVLRAAGFSGPILLFGWPHAFVPHGNPERLFAEAGLTAEAIAARIREALSRGVVSKGDEG